MRPWYNWTPRTRAYSLGRRLLHGGCCSLRARHGRVRNHCPACFDHRPVSALHSTTSPGACVRKLFLPDRKGSPINGTMDTAASFSLSVLHPTSPLCGIECCRPRDPRTNSRREDKRTRREIGTLRGQIDKSHRLERRRFHWASEADPDDRHEGPSNRYTGYSLGHDLSTVSWEAVYRFTGCIVARG